LDLNAIRARAEENITNRKLWVSLQSAEDAQNGSNDRVIIIIGSNHYSGHMQCRTKLSLKWFLNVSHDLSITENDEIMSEKKINLESFAN
jgi:hypothetical protein